MSRIFSRPARRDATGTVVYDQMTTPVLACKLTQQNGSEGFLRHCMCFLHLIVNFTQVQIEKKIGKYGMEYSHASASDVPALVAGGAR